MLTNPDTPFDEDGHSDILSDIRRLYLMVAGGTNDLNRSAVAADQDGLDEGEAPVADTTESTASTGTFAGCSVYRPWSSLQTYAPSSTADLIFTAAEFDPNAMANLSTGRVTIREAGVYLLMADIFAVNTGGTSLSINAVFTGSFSPPQVPIIGIAPITIVYLTLPLKSVVRLVVGDYFSVSLTNAYAGGSCDAYGTLSAIKIGD